MIYNEYGIYLNCISRESNVLILWCHNVTVYNSTCISQKPLNRILILGKICFEDTFPSNKNTLLISFWRNALIPDLLKSFINMYSLSFLLSFCLLSFVTVHYSFSFSSVLLKMDSIQKRYLGKTCERFYLITNSRYKFIIKLKPLGGSNSGEY